MSLFSKIFSKDDLVNAGVCPNCWGQQEYDGVVRKMIQEKQVDVT